MLKLTKHELNSLVADLQGTCKSIEEGLTSIGLDNDQYDAADVEGDIEDIERCCTCSWWFEPCEMKDNGECESCNPEEDDE